MPIRTSEIQLNVNDQKVNAYLASPENRRRGVLVLHAWWGLKPFFRQLCDQLATQGFVALAPDLRNGQIAETIKAAQELMEKSDDQFTGNVIMTAKDYLCGITQGKIGVMGFSMGAAWALVLASDVPDQVAATVLFYGTYDVNFEKVTSKVLGHYSDNDEWEPYDGVQKMESDMKAAGVDVALHTYPKVGHWFVESDRPEYDSASALLVWSRTYEFLRKNL